jgi:16S rRNA (cytosine967-C5)-methyltransferase
MPRPSAPRSPAASRATVSARELAADLANAVLIDSQSLTQAMERARRGDPESRTLAAAQDLAYGIMRNLGRLGYYLDQLLERPLQPTELQGLLLVGLYELDRGETPAYAAVNEAVEQAARQYPRARGLVNGVLRSFQRRQKELTQGAQADPEGRHNFPVWWQERLAAEYPERWSELLATLNLHPPMTLRVNPRQVQPEAYAEQLQAAGIAARQTGKYALTLDKPLPVHDLPGFAEGWVSVQDLGAQYAADLLEVADGMHVLDACAAPGGKTAHLLEGHSIDLLALDSDGRRLERVKGNLKRLGLNAKVVVGDAGLPKPWWDGRPFDRILLDAPCTASGVVRRHPDGKWLKRPEDATHLASLQARLLDAVWPLLGRGGKLLYATCSLFREENEAQAEHFLRRHDDARREMLHLPGGAGGQLLPSSDHDGFFYARFVKT